ncbi:hypothetical protein HMI55_002425 [Coelomomyces lativittatus]|nr:hypothetical protein HMI55_002425 [Coelomomyces lativittatus]
MLNRSVSLSNGIFHSPPSLTTTTTPPPPPPPPSSSSHPSTLSTTPLLPRPSFSSSSPSSLSLLPRFQMEQPPLPLSSSTKKTHSRLPAWWVHYRWILGFSIFILLPSLVLLFVYHQTLLNVLAQFASFVRGSPRLGTLVCMLYVW